MGKKAVPDWLNSSLWSSQPHADPLPHPPDTLKPEPALREPSPPPPPPAPPPKPEPAAHIPRDPGPSEFSPEEISHQAQILSELSKKVINVDELRRLVCQGIPDGARIRPTIWKLLLHYLPNDRSLWPHELENKRCQYKSLKEELLQNPSEITRKMDEHAKLEELNSESRALLQRSEISQGEHPLSLGPTSVWNQYFQEAEIVEQIDRDVKRTHPDMQFFSGNSYFAKTNQESLRHILIMFAKLNPGIRYVQGMNEVLAPLFYVFRNDPEEKSVAKVEADTFFCFVELLSGFRDNFCKQLDNSVVGIRSTISKLSQLLKKHDEELWRHLEITTHVNPHFYAFRWITLLLTQEFDFSDCLSIWDTILSDPEGPQACSSGRFGSVLLRTMTEPCMFGSNFSDCLSIWDTILSDPEGPQETLLRICCAMLILVRRRLLAGDFTGNLKLLQHYPATNIRHLLYVANKLRGSVPD